MVDRPSDTTGPRRSPEARAGAADAAPVSDLGALEEPLQRIRRFLYDFNAQVTYFPPAVRLAYALEGFGELGELRQVNYRLKVPRSARGLPLGLDFECCGAGPPLVCQVAGTRAVIQQHADYLRQHGLSFNAEAVYADAHLGTGPADLLLVAFHIAPRVPVNVTFDADTREGWIRLHAWNLERLGRVSYPLRPGVIDDRFLAELSKALLRQPSRLNAIAGFQVPEETRERLRQRIYLDARRKALELADAQAKQRPRGLLACLVGRRWDRG